MLGTRNSDWYREPRFFRLVGAPLMRRGFVDDRPKKLAASKLCISNIIAGLESAMAPCDQVVFLSDQSESDRRRAIEFVQDRCRVLPFPYTYELFVEAMFSLTRPSLISFDGAEFPELVGGWRETANMLDRFYPGRCAEHLKSEKKSWVWEAGEPPIVYETLPGKIRVLGIEDMARRFWDKESKAWQRIEKETLSSRLSKNFPKVGWSCGSLGLSPASSSETEILKFESCVLEIEGAGLGFGKRLFKRAEDWLAKVSGSEVKNVYFNFPSLTLCAAAKESFDKYECKSPSLQWGFCPVATLLATINQKSPSLIISLATFPFVGFMKVTPVDQ